MEGKVDPPDHMEDDLHIHSLQTEYPRLMLRPTRVRPLIRHHRCLPSLSLVQFHRFSAYPMMKISVSTNISVLEFYGYIIYIDRYFYMNIDISKINKNTLKFMKILSKSVKITLIIKYIH